MSSSTEENSLLQAPIAVILAWLIPGLGHIFLGLRIRGIILLMTITLTFWTGVAIGGMKTVNPISPPYNQRFEPEYQMKFKRSWWFYGQLMTGSYAIAAYSLGKRLDDFSREGRPRYLAWPSSDVGDVYTGVAGLLNLLVILDALARAEGFGVFNRRTRTVVMSTGPPAKTTRHKGGGKPNG